MKSLTSLDRPFDLLPGRRTEFPLDGGEARTPGVERLHLLPAGDGYTVTLGLINRSLERFAERLDDGPGITGGQLVSQAGAKTH